VPLVHTRRSLWERLLVQQRMGLERALGGELGVPCPSISERCSDWMFWQCGDDGTIAGISQKTDLDRFNGTLEDLERLTGPSPDGRRAPEKAAGRGRSSRRRTRTTSAGISTSAPVDAGDSRGMGGCSGAQTGPELGSALALALLGSCLSLRC
jgi:hypothetical protein